MKGKWILFGGVVAVLLLALCVGLTQAQEPQAPGDVGAPSALGTAFTYQGQLKHGGSPVNGACDCQFSLWDAASGGARIGAMQTKAGVNVVGGLFTISDLDFGGTAFTGDARWLETAVRCPAGSGAYTTLSPRQPLTAVPYALSLRPGAWISGTAYQNLKVMSYAPTGGIPAGVTGEQNVAKDGVGVYGSNSVSTADATGMGVWGRTWSPRGYGVAGSAYNGAAGVYGHSWSDNGIGVYASAPITGVFGVVTDGTYGTGVYGRSPYVGVWGESSSTYAAGVQGWNEHGMGVGGYGGTWGVYGRSATGTAVYAQLSNASGTLMRGVMGVGFGATTVFRLDSAGKGFFNGGFQTGGADVAEFVAVSGDPQPGDVVEIDPDHAGRFRLAATPNSTAVAGVISTQPGASLGAVDPAAAENAGPQLALVGNVPVKVCAENGAIRPGDLLVASSTPGHAMRAPANPAPGTVIGKALGNLANGAGIIQMLAMLR